MTTEKLDTDRALAVGGAALVRKAFAESPVHLTAEEREVLAQYFRTVDAGPDAVKPTGATLAYERGLLGRILTQKGALDDAADMVQPRHFWDAAHRDLYSAILEIERTGRGLDTTAIVEHLGRASKITTDWFALIAACRKDDSPTDTKQKAAAVFGGWQRRQIAAMGAALYHRALGSSVHDGDEILSDASDLLAQLETPSDARVEEMGIGDAVVGMRRDVHRRAALAGEGALPGMPTGWPRMDFYLGGWVPGNIVIIKGMTGGGKTAFGLSAVLKAAKRALADPNGPNVGSVAVISMEMDCYAIATRIAANIGEIDAQDLRLAKLNDGQWDALWRAERDALAMNDVFRILYKPGLTVAALKRTVRRLMRRKGVPPLKVLVVDYLQLLATPHMASREQEVSEISKALGEIAKGWGVNVIALSQMNKDGDARESRRIEQDADVVITLKPTDPDADPSDSNHVYNIIVQKNRHGLTVAADKWRMIFSKRYQRFLELKEDAEQKRSNWYDNDNRPEAE